MTVNLTRRVFIRQGACLSAMLGCSFAGAPLTHAEGKDALAETAETFFICDTQQITSIDLQPYVGADLDAAAISINSAPPSQSVDLDLYTTAQRALRWRETDVQLVRAGKPVVRIKFADGSDWQQGQVRSLAAEWQAHAIEVDFEFVDSSRKAEITISFSGSTNKSETGRESRGPSYAGAATMFLPEVRKNTSASTWRRVILHEFGHGVMTFGHEHRHAEAHLRFKSASYIRDSINARLGRNAWTIGMVQTNITNPPYSPSRTCTDYDTRSIMHYPIQADWLEAGTPVPSPSTTLSQRDIQCARTVYS